MQRVTLENETKVGLLYALKGFTTETVKGLLFSGQAAKSRTIGSRPAGRRWYIWRACRI